jgi:hypothetical protein
MPRYNHAYTIAFEVISETVDASDVTPEMLADALRDRARNALRTGEIIEATGAPFDTFAMPICPTKPTTR